MSMIAPDSFDFERSRAAVAVACLQWLRCTGPMIESEPLRSLSPDLPPIAASLAQDNDPGDSPHPLWDQWLDGWGVRESSW
jgi:hypothetical protein